MFKDFLINYGFESNSNELHTTWVRNRTIFYVFRTCAALFGIAIYIVWFDKK